MMVYAICWNFWCCGLKPDHLVSIHSAGRNWVVFDGPIAWCLSRNKNHPFGFKFTLKTPQHKKYSTKYQRVSYWPGSFLQDGVIGKVKPWDLNNVCRSRSAFRIDLQFAALRNDSELRRCPTSSIALRAKRFTRLPLAWGGNACVLLVRGGSSRGKVKYKTLVIVFYEWYL